MMRDRVQVEYHTVSFALAKARSAASPYWLGLARERR